MAKSPKKFKKKFSKAEPDAPKFDVYAKVTDAMIRLIEKGVKPWMRPWNAPAGAFRGVLPLRFNGKPYSGINIVILWGAAVDKGYVNPRWMTFKQALDLGGCVRKDENGEKIVQASTFVPKDEKARAERDGDEATKVPYLKTYTVFNVEQIDGLPETYYIKPEDSIPLTPVQQIERIDHCDAFFKEIGAVVKHGGHRAYLSRATGEINLPDFEKFHSPEAYYATSAHEHIHWTGMEKRLNREFGKRFGDNAYAFEELIAEMGSAFTCAHLGIDPVDREDHAAYLANWLTVLRGDKKAIFAAATAAQKGAEMLLEFAGEKAPKVLEEPEAEQVAA